MTGFFFFIMLSAPTTRPRRVSTSAVVTMAVLEHSPRVVLWMQTWLFRSFAGFACESMYRFQGNSASNTTNIFVVFVFSHFSKQLFKFLCLITLFGELQLYSSFSVIFDPHRPALFSSIGLSSVREAGKGSLDPVVLH